MITIENRSLSKGYFTYDSIKNLYPDLSFKKTRIDVAGINGKVFTDIYVDVKQVSNLIGKKECNQLECDIAQHHFYTDTIIKQTLI